MPPSTLYFENSLVSVSAHPAGYAQLTYHAGQYASDDLATALRHAGDLLQRRHWHRLLEDQRQLVRLTTEEQSMVAQYWQRQTCVLGHSLCVATVLAQDVFARLAAATLRHELRAADIKYRVFSDPATASSWLRLQAGCPPHE